MDMRTLINLATQSLRIVEEENVFEGGGYIIDEGIQGIIEKAPLGKKAQRFIKKLKPEFKKRYGDAWKQVLYATAWKNFG